ncbi:MAG: rod shape-determining protein MreC [Actinomycetota bacterium]|nr:rod shape-determining protein MreC [Actinomycetota bacterium]
MYRRSGRGRLLLFVFIALAILVITLDFRQSGGPLEGAKDVSVTVVAPIQRGLTSVFRPIGDFFASIGDLGNLRRRNAELEAELEALRAEVHEAESIQHDFAELSRLHDLDRPWTEMDKVTARIIGESPSNYRWTRTIDKGRADGIELDMAVVNADGLVGKIVKPLTDNTATVLLLIDPKGAAGARIGDERDTGTIQGTGNGRALSLELIDSNSDVRAGDPVVTSGYDGSIFPPGIPIGSVEEVFGDARDPDHTIVVEPWATFDELDYVLVLLETGRSIAGTAGER